MKNIEEVHAGLTELIDRDMIDYIVIHFNNTLDLFVHHFTLHISDLHESALVNFYDRNGHYLGCCMAYDIEDIGYRLK